MDVDRSMDVHVMDIHVFNSYSIVYLHPRILTTFIPCVGCCMAVESFGFIYMYGDV